MIKTVVKQPLKICNTYRLGLQLMRLEQEESGNIDELATDALMYI